MAAARRFLDEKSQEHESYIPVRSIISKPDAKIPGQRLTVQSPEHTRSGSNSHERKTSACLNGISVDSSLGIGALYFCHE